MRQGEAGRAVSSEAGGQWHARLARECLGPPPMGEPPMPLQTGLAPVGAPGRGEGDRACPPRRQTTCGAPKASGHTLDIMCTPGDYEGQLRNRRRR